MKIIWYGTASLGIVYGKDKILIDPFLPLHGSKVPHFLEEYRTYRKILVTHGHLDHIGNLSEIVDSDDTMIFCTKTPLKTLKRDGLKNIRGIRPGNELQFKNLKVKVFQGKHVQYDKPLLRKTFLSDHFILHLKDALKIGSMFRSYPENGETVGYMIEAGGRSVFVMGSLNLDESTVYPKGMDVCVLPYQGCSNLTEQAEWILKILQPKAVILDHYDDTFPPISAGIDTEEIQKKLREMGIEYITAAYGTEVVI